MSQLISNQRHLSQWVREQEGSLDIAVAFWGAGALKDLGLDRSDRRVRVLLDLSAGATNPSVVRDLVNTYPGMIRRVDRLHAKAYLAETEIVVGSANASANGLGLEGAEATQWRELGMVSTDAATVQEAHTWFNDLWSFAKLIDLDSDEFTEAQRLWRQRHANRSLPQTSSESLIAAVIANPSSFTGRDLYVVVDLADMDAAGDTAVALKKEETGQPAYAWQGWSDIPRRAYLISFHKDGRMRFAFSDEGAQEPVYFTREEYEGPMQFVEASYIPGFRKNLGDIEQWRELLKRAESNATDWVKNDGMCMDLGEFARKYSNPQLLDARRES
ncbi:phospholipase D family protein [Pseudomonas sp. Irchel s3h14]|uniref:phospholipase D family protein n=1 Tax=Pseudomonas sp. Irchel s3h14 TaxID=2009179 RepID=UPI000BA2D418|nr:phospholipase D family protein [Pseudomonas sp. Irchel s3h14]